MDSEHLFCLFCGCPVPKHYDTFREENLNFSKGRPQFVPSDDENFHKRDEITIQLVDCPNCRNVSIDIIGKGRQFRNRIMNFNPISLAKSYPNYIPLTIREDYEEAHAILNLSPKASATLSRRCLQGMIRDFWQVSKRSLSDEIEAINDLVDPSTRKVLDALRKIGNIGAHPEKDINLIVDIEPLEAHKLLKFIELLMQKWYIERHDNETLLQDILDMDTNKQSQRKPKNS
ncbi:TPA: DUF4145 domain-containing protein [Streptococcus pyogenes]|uniref:DUF4145 domain-containing protein n=2 Tax=Streptococcus TaxID=1301 RepID=A0A0E3WF00_9STRE|nr:MULTISPECIES: DUF4145 domain-containing protein [Streptococcus]MCY7220419.1 DUF4145 domain-containing protein [Streptococcus dysgalactiae]MDY2963827.1 DUF4145 domain-containing protein [Streptococcus dysgalactiae]MDY4034419.1 DUF4145 domain-containing protein [Streptococcus dysgalactiae]OAF77622.1 hypothetical protein AXK22_02585 [Streptococcus pyogenes]OBZ05867.1 hypothetical protein BBG04_02970 [Streptococcus dysgalactiae subsp. equisimilis]